MSVSDETVPNKSLLKVGDRVITLTDGIGYLKGWVGNIFVVDNSGIPYHIEFENGQTHWVHYERVKIYEDEEVMLEETIPTKEAICAWIDGQEIEYYTNVNGCWSVLTSGNSIGISRRVDVLYRIKPKPKKQYKVFGVLFDEDELPQTSLKPYQVFYYMSFWGDVLWEHNFQEDMPALKTKRAFLTEEACLKWYKAMGDFDFLTCEESCNEF